MREHSYLCIDLKSFFASVECVERGLDPMKTNLVVADPERGGGTVCLAVTPAMKALGVKNRCRVFEIPPHISYIKAPPRMQKYIDYASRIYAVYLQYVSPDDIHVYSIDEVFIDATPYLSLYQMTQRQMAQHLMDAVFTQVGVRATCGIGSNLYLAKIALDILAKHAPDFIGELDETTYRESLWDHLPLTDFWRIGPGTAKKLVSHGIFTMGDIAHCDRRRLYDWFGIDAELLIDHAWGREPTTIADIKAYRARSHSLSSGQVLMRDYTFEEALLIVKEMTDQLCLDMEARGVVCDSVTLGIRYSRHTLAPIAKGSVKLPAPSNLSAKIIPRVLSVYQSTADRTLPIRQIHLSCNHILTHSGEEQISFFEDPTLQNKQADAQSAVLGIKRRYGKNAIFKGMSLQEGATARERNRQIGGHKSGS